MNQLEGIIFEEPFPHLIVNNFYNKEELDLILESLSVKMKMDEDELKEHDSSRLDKFEFKYQNHNGNGHVEDE